MKVKLSCNGKRETDFNIVGASQEVNMFSTSVFLHAEAEAGSRCTLHLDQEVLAFIADHVRFKRRFFNDDED